MNRARLLIGGAMVVAFTVLSMQLMAGGRPSERFVVPDDYMGPLIAVYDQPGGAVPAKRGDTLVYMVPPTGVVRIAGPGPEAGTRVDISMAGANVGLPILHSCEALVDVGADGKTRACWFGFEFGGTGIPYHIAGIVSSAQTIAANYDRTALVLDSAVLGWKGASKETWASRVAFEREKELRRQKR